MDLFTQLEEINNGTSEVQKQQMIVDFQKELQTIFGDAISKKQTTSNSHNNMLPYIQNGILPF